ncbi:MAG: PAS domain S-box protein [Alphaproteobacteria bacterium]|nr:PAS domain S-box protein [Alphaproteobacteria bacterium]
MTRPKDMDADRREADRLAALRRYDILDTPAEEPFDRVTRLTASIIGTPIALVSLIDDSRQWFKSRHGLDATETPLSDAFCAHAIQSDGIMEVPDASRDPRFADNPLVTGEPRIRFYAGAPLITRDGQRLGTLCVIDSKPRSLSAEHARFLADFSRIIVDQLELRKAGIEARRELAERNRLEEEARASELRFGNLAEGSLQGVHIHDGQKLVFANQRLADILGYDSPEEMLALGSIELLIAPHDRVRVRERRKRRLRGDELPASFEYQGLRKDGSVVDLLRSAHSVDWNGKSAVQNTIIDISEQKRAIRELRQNQKILEALADNLPAFISLKDVDGRFQFANKRFEEWVQINRQDVIGKTVHDIYDADQASQFEALDREAIDHGSIVAREIDLAYPDGHTRHVVSTRFPVFSDSHEIIGLGTINYDLSERRRVEEALRQSEADHRALLEGSVMGVVIDRAGKPLFVNQAYAEIFGCDSPDEILSLPTLDSLYQPQDLARIKRYRMSRLRQKPAPVVYEFGGVRKDGTPIELETRSRPIMWEGKLAVQSTVIDRTERKKLEAEKALNEQRFRDLAEAASHFMVELDPDMNLTFFHGYLRNVPEVEPGKSIGQIMLERGFDPAGMQRLFEKIKRRGTFMDLPISRDHPVHGKAHLMLSGKPCYGENGAYQGFRGTIRDITAQIDAQAEITAARHELDLIKAANEAKSQFLANMSHELRTPLNAVLGFSELIKAELLGPVGVPAYVEYAGNIHDSATHLRGIIDELFDLSQIEDGKYALALQEMPLQEVIGEVVSVMTHDAAKAGVSVDTSRVNRAIRATIDRTAIRRVLGNLLSNNIQFTPAGGSISIETMLSMDRSVTIRVTDTGRGIPPGRMSRIFEVLRQDDAYIAREGGRMGMGLRIGRMLARMHGGDLTLESRVDHGTTVTVILPLDGPKAKAPATEEIHDTVHG